MSEILQITCSHANGISLSKIQIKQNLSPGCSKFRLRTFWKRCDAVFTSDQNVLLLFSSINMNNWYVTLFSCPYGFTSKFMLTTLSFVILHNKVLHFYFHLSERDVFVSYGQSDTWCPNKDIKPNSGHRVHLPGHMMSVTVIDFVGIIISVEIHTLWHQIELFCKESSMKVQCSGLTSGLLIKKNKAANMSLWHEVPSKKSTQSVTVPTYVDPIQWL